MKILTRGTVTGAAGANGALVPVSHQPPCWTNSGVWGDKSQNTSISLLMLLFNHQV